MSSKLYTILVNFADYIVGIRQYEAERPERALELFVQENESVRGYDRERLRRAINPLMQIRELKGFWVVSFSEHNIGGEDDNPVLGGHIIQSDASGPTP
jgi:hypothetical protein